MKKTLASIALLTLIITYANGDDYDSPTVNSRLASSAQFPDENSFNDDGKTPEASAPKAAHKTQAN